MSRRTRVTTLCNAYNCSGPADVKVHSSGLFFVKGRAGYYNGVVMNKLIQGVEFIIIFKGGKELEVNRKVYYFEDNAELRIYLEDGEMRRFKFSPTQGEFEEVRNAA